jgi:beta-1,4-mannosyltransferase
MPFWGDVEHRVDLQSGTRRRKVQRHSPPATQGSALSSATNPHPAHASPPVQEAGSAQSSPQRSPDLGGGGYLSPRNTGSAATEILEAPAHQYRVESQLEVRPRGAYTRSYAHLSLSASSTEAGLATIPTVRRIPVASRPRPRLGGQMLWEAGRAIRPHRVDWSLLLHTNLYRLWLIVFTIGLTLLLYRLQNLLGAVPAHPTEIQIAVQWGELIWLVPVPLSLALWLGWLIFAEVGRPDPAPTGVPWAETGTAVTVVIRIVTRGDNLQVLRETVNAVHQSFAGYLPQPGPYRIEVVSDRAVSLDNDPSGLTRVIVVPADFRPSAGSLYKARALTYLQSQIKPGPADWYLYLDEESKLDSSVIAGIYRFIGRTLRSGAHRRRGRVIGQGAILYQGGHWFFRGADGLRTADDLGRFRLQYALGMPLFGIHGSYILVSGQDDQRLSFDVGPRNSLTEDAAWALRAWALGYRFGWVEGYLHEQPPQHIMDFIRQRARWLSGIRLVITDRGVPLRYRAGLGIFTLLWQLAFLPFVVAVAAVVVHVTPFAWMQLPADFAWAAFVLAYLQGAHVQARRSAAASTEAAVISKRPSPERPPQRLNKWRRAILMAASWVMILCYVWFALLEALGVLYSLKPSRGFFVIRKPSLTRASRVEGSHVRTQPQSLIPTAPLEPSG